MARRGEAGAEDGGALDPASVHAEDGGALDPASVRGEEVACCEAWLAFQRAMAFEPERALARLGRARSPLVALSAEGVLVAVALEAAARDRAALARAGAVVVPHPCAAYPPALRALVDAPPVLCVRGDPSVLRRPAVAIVGARAATVDGLDTAHELARSLARRGLVVVSGLARGIDAAAHRGALEAGGVTVAVQACGADRVYPAEHRGLAARIAERGAVVTELPVDAAPRPAHFPLRNRLISGLALATVVVEARLRSGSLTTAAHALAQGREVLAVPGPLRAPTSEGPNRLLRDGAAPMLDAGDVLAALPEAVVDALVDVAPGTGSQAEGGEAVPAAAGTAPRALDARDRALLAELDRAARSRDGLARTLGWSASEVAARLLALEVEGAVHQDRDGRFRRRRRTTSRDRPARASLS